MGRNELLMGCAFLSPLLAGCSRSGLDLLDVPPSNMDASPPPQGCTRAPAPGPTTLLAFTEAINNSSFMFTGDAARLYTLVFGRDSASTYAVLSVDACNGSTVVLGSSSYRGAIASEPGVVYYTSPQPDGTENIVSSGPLGEHTTVVGTFTDPTDTVVTLAVHGGRAYGVTYDGSSLVSWALDGSPATTLVPTDPGFARVFWGALAVDDERVYFNGLYGLQSIPPDGGPITTLWSDGLNHLCGGSEPPGYPLLAVDDAYVYASGYDGLWRIAKDGSSVLQYPGAVPDCGPVVLDGDYLYFADEHGSNPAAIHRVPKAGGTPTTIAGNANIEGGLVVTATSLYWLIFANDIMRMDKP
jgi:hypothetical protein